MNDLLILYPKEFNCYSKFERKVQKIVSNLKDLNIYFLHDSKLLIERYAKSNKHVLNCHKTLNWEANNYSYVIVFDDGEEFIEECKVIKNKDTPLRIINIPITRVINIKIDDTFEAHNNSNSYCYIGRGSYWGNPHSMFENGDSREDVIRKYKYDFDFDKFINKKKSKVYALQGKRLGCFCKPESCHGDILADYLNSWDDGM